MQKTARCRKLILRLNFTESTLVGIVEIFLSSHTHPKIHRQKTHTQVTVTQEANLDAEILLNLDIVKCPLPHPKSTIGY
jgi:hypothetical protein